MKKMIAVALGLFTALVLAVYGLIYWENYDWNEENVPVQVAASDSGVYLLHPNHRPKRLLRWRSENHALLQEDIWYALDGDTLYRFCAADWSTELLYTGIDLDWSLGAAAIAVGNGEVYYLPPEEPHWGTVLGMDGAEVQLRTLVHLTPQGQVHQNIPVDTTARPVLRYSYDHLYSVARDREGRIALAVNSDLSSRRKSDWIDPGEDRVYLNAYNDLRLVGMQSDGTLRFREMKARTGEFRQQEEPGFADLPAGMEAYTLLYDAEERALLLYRDELGSLRLLEEQIGKSRAVDLMSFFPAEVIETANYRDNCLTLTEGSTTWAYVFAARRYGAAGWKCYRLP